MDAWRKFAKATCQIERQFHPLFLKTTLTFRSSLTAYIRTHGIQSAQTYLTGHLDLGVSPILQDLYKKAGLLGAEMSYGELKKAVGKKGYPMHLQTKGFGLNQAWINEVLNYLKLHLLNLAQAITETMKEDALKVLSTGIQNGWGVDKMVSELEKPDLPKARAQVIARTEVVRAANVGHAIGAQSIPYEVLKKWVSAQDHRTRHSHAETNQHTTGENDTFRVAIYRNSGIVGYDEMLAPGDPTASAANTINCRCRVVYEPKRDAQGNLIPRTGTPARIIPLRATNYGSSYQIAAALRKAIQFGLRND